MKSIGKYLQSMLPKFDQSHVVDVFVRVAGRRRSRSDLFPCPPNSVHLLPFLRGTMKTLPRRLPRIGRAVVLPSSLLFRAVRLRPSSSLPRRCWLSTPSRGEGEIERRPRTSSTLETSILNLDDLIEIAC